MKLQRLYGAIGAGLMLFTLLLPAKATEQSTLVTPTTGPMSMATFAGSYLNPALRALGACNWGPIAPANGPGSAPLSYQTWCDTTTNPVVVKMYDGASWVTVGKLNTSSHGWTPSYQGTDLGTASTATTGTSAHTLGFLDGANTWSAVQSFNSGMLSLKGSSSGAGTLNAPAVASTYVWTLPAVTDTLVSKTSTDTLTNKTLTSPTINGGTLNSPAINAADNTFVVVGSVDPSKRIFFEVDGLTTATDRTLTVPDANLTIVGTATTQALTNKTYNGNTWTAGTGVLTIGAAKTATISNTLTFAGTDGSTITLGAGGTVLYSGGALGTPSSATLTNATGLPVGGHAAQAAYTFIGNNSGSSAIPTAVDIAGLTTKASPGASDYVMLSDQAASGAWKKATVSSVASAGSVSSFNTLTGAVTYNTAPQGRLTLTTGKPVMVADATAQGTIYYDCHVGNQVPYYTGAADAYDTISSCEVSTAMVSAASAGQVVSGQVYDVWWVHGGANRICVAMSASSGGGGGWASDTAGSATARGTGYSQLDLTTRPYITNKNSITNCFNAATNYGPVSANQGTYLGTFYATANGQTGMQFKPSAAAGGSNNILGVSNGYNRVLTTSTARDSTSSWTISSTTWRAQDNNTNNQIRFVDGLQQSFVVGSTNVTGGITGATSGGAAIGTALNWSSGAPGTTANYFGTSTFGSLAFISPLSVTETFAPVMGFNTLNGIEAGAQANSFTFYGTGSGIPSGAQSHAVSIQVFM